MACAEDSKYSGCTLKQQGAVTTKENSKSAITIVASSVVTATLILGILGVVVLIKKTSLFFKVVIEEGAVQMDDILIESPVFIEQSDDIGLQELEDAYMVMGNRGLSGSTQEQALGVFGSTQTTRSENSYPYMHCRMAKVNTEPDPEPLYAESGFTKDPEPLYSERDFTKDPNPLYAETDLTKHPEPLYSEPDSIKDPEPLYAEPDLVTDPEPLYSEPDPTKDPESLYSEPDPTKDPEPLYAEPDLITDPEPLYAEPEPLYADNEILGDAGDIYAQVQFHGDRDKIRGRGNHSPDKRDTIYAKIMK